MFVSASRLVCEPLTLLFGFLFTIATPIGVGIMWGEGDTGLRKIDPVMLIIQGCTCGGVIYISCSDLIAREF